jgi:hypothetical protein
MDDESVQCVVTSVPYPWLRSYGIPPSEWPEITYTPLPYLPDFKTNNVPYHSHYDRYGPLLGYDKARFATFYDSEMDRFGAGNVDGVLMPHFKHV